VTARPARRFRLWWVTVALVLSIAGHAAADPPPVTARIPRVTGLTDTELTDAVRGLLCDVVVTSYPSLEATAIEVGVFHSQSDYFRTSFSIRRFLSGRQMRYRILVNPDVVPKGADPDGVRSIVAHELGHVLDFQSGKRIRLLGLVRLLIPRCAATFERRTDLEAIGRGFAEGLKAYRRWLYLHVPADRLHEKRRNYFSPEEIDAIVACSAGRPDRMAYWKKHVPRCLADILSTP
jgi:hypothetical protein